jgi:Transcriptional regulator
MNIVHFEQEFMNPNITSKEEILNQCRLIVQAEGLGALTMRHVAEQCGTALGSLYNYFPSKDDLILESIRSIWQDVFHEEGESFDPKDFRSLVHWFSDSLGRMKKLYPGFFTLHAMSFGSEEKEKGKAERDRVFAHMKDMMRMTLAQDPKVQKDAFSTMPEDQFVDIVFLSIIYSHLESWNDEEGLTALINKTLY